MIRRDRLNANLMKVSVITPSYNQVEFIKRSVESVLSQQGDFELEYIVIDGDSTDGTREFLEGFSDRLRLISEADEGQSDAINKGLALAGGEVVCWLNADDILAEGCLQNVVAVFKSEPETRWVYGKVNIIDKDDREIRRFVTWYKSLRMAPFSYSRLIQENWISQMGVFWRRSFGEQIGPLNVNLHYSMDYDYWMRFAQVSLGRYIPKQLASFRWHDQSKTCNHYAKQMTESYRLAKKYAAGKYPISIMLHRVLAIRTLATYRVLGLFSRDH